MVSTDDFVQRENLNSFVGRLATETDPSTQRTLRRLLLEEERRFGVRQEALALLDGYIARNGELIDGQSQLVTILRDGGRDTKLDEALLDSLVETRTLFLEYRETLVVALERGQLG